MPLLTLAAMALMQSGAQGSAALNHATVTMTSKVIQGLRPLAFAASPDGSKFAMTMEDDSVRIMDASTHQTIRTLGGLTQPAYAVAWSADGEYLATGDESARIVIWNARNGQRLKTIIGHIRGIQKLSFNSSRSTLMSDGNDDVINMWDVTTGKKTGTILGKGMNVYGAVFSPKSDCLLVGTLAGGARMYRMTGEGPKLLNFLAYVNPTSQPHGVFDVSYSPDGKRAVTAGNDGQAIIWDTVLYKKIGILKGHDDFVRKAVFSPNGKLIATSSSDRTVRLWDAATLLPVGKLDNECATSSPLAFTADGKYLLSVDVEDFLQVNALAPSQGSTVPTKTPKKPPTWHRRRRG